MDRTFDDLRIAAARCTRCDLYSGATQTVFGEGPHDARIMLVGEQPGDREDRMGRPFVGPAGGILDRALTDAGMNRDLVYVTNAVTHFKWEPRGKVRIHKKPNASEIRACSHWWKEELGLLTPDIVVLLGATAAQAFVGSTVRVTRDRGHVFALSLPGNAEDGAQNLDALVTIHPSAILRMRAEDRDEGYSGLVQDLAVVVDHLGVARG